MSENVTKEFTGGKKLSVFKSPDTPNMTTQCNNGVSSLQINATYCSFTSIQPIHVITFFNRHSNEKGNQFIFLLLLDWNNGNVTSRRC